MPECTACGTRVDEGVRVCPSCGADLAGATAQFEAVSDSGGAQSQASSIEPGGPALFVRKGPETGGTFYLDRDLITVGRDPESSIFLNDVTVSRSHAVIEVVSGQVVVRDAGSLNGTYINGVCTDEATLHDGDVVQIGAFQMVFVSSGGTD